MQEPHFLVVEEIAHASVEQDHARRLVVGDERQRDVRAGLHVVPDHRLRAQSQSLELAVGAALAGARGERKATRAVGEADRGQAKAALLHGDAARLFEQRLAIVRPDDQCIDRGERRERAVQAFDPLLLGLERAGFLEQLVDHQSQVLAVEVACGDGRRGRSRAEQLVDGAQDRVVIGRFDKHSRDAERACQLFRVLAAEIGRIEHHADVRGGRLELQASCQLVAVHLRHQDVGDDELGPVVLRQVERLVAVRGGEDVVPHALEKRRQGLAVGAVIVGDEDLCH